jgi:hypothetical protein
VHPQIHFEVWIRRRKRHYTTTEIEIGFHIECGPPRGRFIFKEPNSYALSKKGIRLMIILKKIKRKIIEEIENNVISYKIYSGKNNNVFNPKLPIKECPQLAAIVTNLICDGSELNGAGEYSNKSITLIRNFEKNLKYVFGNVKTKIYCNRYKRQFLFRFPKIILKIIKKFYGIEFGTFTGRLPQSFFKLPKKYAAYAIRAAFDDEGNVEDNAIKFTSSNKLFLNDIKNIMISKFPELSKNVYTFSDGNCFRLYVRKDGIRCFSKYIGFNHPKKIDELRFQMERINRGRTKLKPQQAKNKILECINENQSMNTRDICRYLMLKDNTALRHLHSLKFNGFIGLSKIKHKGIAYRWNITEAGKKALCGGG